MIATNYYCSYADHMWRFYIRYRDGQTGNLSAPDRANWTACDTVYHHISPEWQTVTALYYQRKDPTSPTAQTVEDYCQAHAMTMATVMKIIRAVQNMAAEERGLIAKREVRMNRPYSTKPVYRTNVKQIHR